MDSLAATWIQFLVCVVLITTAGARLSRYADIIGRKTGWSGTWAGLILLSTVTSLPELATGISAAGFANAPDIAAGDILGSCVFNLLIVAVIDMVYRDKPLFCAIEPTHALAAALGIGLIALTGGVLLLGQRLDGLAIWNVGMHGPAIMVLYLFAMRLIYRQNQQRQASSDMREQPDGKAGDLTLRRAISLYAVAATVVVGAGAWLPFVAMRLSKLMGWHDAFVGTLFVAVATSLPELSVSLTALRLGQPDMAIANLLGSNLFNMVVLAIDDLFYRPGPLLSNVAPIHALSAFATLAMSAIVVAALLTRPSRRVLGIMTWPSIALLAVFALNSAAQYLFAEK